MTSETPESGHDCDLAVTLGLFFIPVLSELVHTVQ